MKKYDFEKMGGIWKNHARVITKKGVFVASSRNWDLWEYSGIVYSIPISGSGCSASSWCSVSRIKSHLQHLKNICGGVNIFPCDWENINFDFFKENGIY